MGELLKKLLLEGTVGTFNFTWHLAFLFIASYVVPIW